MNQTDSVQFQITVCSPSVQKSSEQNNVDLAVKVV